MDRNNQTALVEAVNFFLPEDMTWNYSGVVPDEFTQSEFKRIKWLKKGEVIHGDEVSLKSPVTYKTFLAKYLEIKGQVVYQRSRKAEYPSVAEQLDMLWHAIDSGALNTDSEFYIQLKAVKDKYPKA